MSQPDGELRRKTLQGLVWQFLGVGGQRIVALVGPVVIARSVSQDDIGLFAIVLTGIAVVESLTLFMGEQSTISSTRGLERRYQDTVFTVRLARSIVISGLLCALAPAFAWFFRDPERDHHYWLTGLFLTLAANGFLDGLQSPARAGKLKGMEFRRIVLGDFLAALLGMFCTIGFALWWRDVWALVIGHLCGTSLRTILSYVVAPHRPRLQLDREVLRELFHYGKGAAGAPFLLVMIFASPALVLGRFLVDAQGNRDRAGIAVFDYAARLARLPEDVFLRVIAPVAVPAYAQLRLDRPRLARAWLGAVRAFLLIGGPMSVALAWLGGELPSIVFGSDYGEIDGLFALQALHGGMAGLTAVVGPLFWAVGIPGEDRRAQLFRSIAIYAVGIPATISYGVVGFAWGMIAGISVALVLSMVSALRYLQLGLGQLLATGRDGALSCVCLAVVLLAVDGLFAPHGWWRFAAAACTSGPLLALATLRILRERRHAPPPPAPEPLPEPMP